MEKDDINSEDESELQPDIKQPAPNINIYKSESELQPDIKQPAPNINIYKSESELQPDTYEHTAHRRI